MKRIKLFVIVLISLFVINVKADMEPPQIVTHKVMVTNKDGAVCYVDGKKSDEVIPYGTTLEVDYDIDGSYIAVYGSDYSCTVKYTDVSSKTQSFDLNTEGVDKITPSIAIILAKGGLNMRKGPSVTYGKITTIPEKTVVTVTHKAGTYWYYTTYNGKSGWITAMNNYIGFEEKEVLINYEKTNIYDSKNEKIIGSIPANTEITDYVLLHPRLDDDLWYYVIYNGTKGYLRNMFYKIDAPGKIKLTKDYTLNDKDGKPIKTFKSDQEFEYTMVDRRYLNGFYVPEKKTVLSFGDEGFEFVKKATITVKKSGYLGEGKFGEKKDNNTVTPTPTETNKENEQNEQKEENNKSTSTGMSSKDIIIICLLGGIFLSLTAIVIIKLMNSKKKSQPVVTPVETRVVNNPLPPREDVHEGVKETVTLNTAINDIKPIENKDDNKQE